MRFFAPKLNCIRIPIKIPKWWSDRPIFWQTKPLTGNEETSQWLTCWSMETINKSGPAKFKMDLEKKHDVLESRLNVNLWGLFHPLWGICIFKSAHPNFPNHWFLKATSWFQCLPLNPNPCRPTALYLKTSFHRPLAESYFRNIHHSLMSHWVG